VNPYDDDDDMGEDSEPGILNMDICILCSDQGRDNAIWYRYTLYSGWARAACNGYDSAKNYVCDYWCLPSKKTFHKSS
jgi:hypothetical protein